MPRYLDTPMAGLTSQLYIDDLYVFRGGNSTVLVMDVNSDLDGNCSRPGFHPEARYEFKIHFGGTEFEALTYRVTFDEPDARGRQALRLHMLIGESARDDSAPGEPVLEGRTGESATASGTRLWAGRAADAFYADRSLLALISIAMANKTAPDLSGWRPEKARNSFAGTFVHSIVLEVSHGHRLLCPGVHTGVWCTTKVATAAGGWRQIDRAGHPMIRPIFFPDDVRFANPASTCHPSLDMETLGEDITERIAAAVAVGGTSEDPEGYGRAVARELFPDVLSYVVGTPAVYGFAARNGRTLADNAAEAMLSLVTNSAVPSGLKPFLAQDQRSSAFPYVVPR